MSKNRTNTITLIFCGMGFDHYTKNGNCIYKAFFVDERFIHYEFYLDWVSRVYLFLKRCKNGQKLKVSWKPKGETWKKIILDAEPTKEEDK